MLVDLIVWLIVGGVAGWLTGLIVKGYGFGLFWNIVIGIVGGLRLGGEEKSGISTVMACGIENTQITTEPCRNSYYGSL